MPKLTWEEAQHTSGVLREWAYNCGDVMGTQDILATLLPRLNPEQARTYSFHRALQAPCMSMMMKGVLVDEPKRAARIKSLRLELNKIAKHINQLPGVVDVWDATTLETGICDTDLGKHHKWPRGVPDSPERKCERCGAPRVKHSPFLPSSDTQRARLFYDLHGIKPITNKEHKVTTDGEAMERIGRYRPSLKPVTDAVDDYQKTQKQIGFLNAPRTAAGRYPSSFNVAAAWTSRFSSSKNPYRLGGNLQNVAEKNRDAFIADPGKWLFYADLEQAESNVVAHLAGDEAYITAHRVGDPHTFVARMLWPELPWTGDLEEDKKIAKNHYPEWDKVPGHDFRFQAKTIQHGGNLGMTPQGIARNAHLLLGVAHKMFYKYHDTFPGIGRWQRNTKATVEAHLPLVTPLGHRVRLFGRPKDPHTYRQGLALKPQSMVAHLINLSMWNVWDAFPDLDLLMAQIHDALLGEVDEGDHATLRRIKELMTIPVDITGIDGKTRTMTLGVELAVGLNWGKAGPSNPDGLKTWKEPS